MIYFNPLTGQILLVNANPEGCNQHSGPDCGANWGPPKKPSIRPKKMFKGLVRDRTKDMEERFARKAATGPGRRVASDILKKDLRPILKEDLGHSASRKKHLDVQQQITDSLHDLDLQTPEDLGFSQEHYNQTMGELSDLAGANERALLAYGKVPRVLKEMKKRRRVFWEKGKFAPGFGRLPTRIPPEYTEYD